MHMDKLTMVKHETPQQIIFAGEILYSEGYMYNEIFEEFSFSTENFSK